MSDHPDYCAGHNDGYEQAVEELKGEGVVAIPRAQYDALMAAAKVFDKYKVDLVIGWTGTDPRRLEIERALAALRAASI